MDYILHLGVLIAIYGVLAVSLDLMAGHAGLPSLAHGVLYGLGAYGSALVCVSAGAPFLVGVSAAAATAIAVSTIVAGVSVRLRGDSFAIGSLAVQMLVLAILANWVDVTRGPLGISDIARPKLFWWVIETKVEFLGVAIGLFALAQGCVILVGTSPLGRVLRAIRESEEFAQAAGKQIVGAKLSVCGCSGVLAAFAGSLYAHYVTYIDPTSFTVMESLLVLSMVIIGGAGSTFGPLLGAAVLVMLPEALRSLGLPAATAANVRQMIYGALLVVMMMARPQGLVGRYAFGR